MALAGTDASCRAFCAKRFPFDARDECFTGPSFEIDGGHPMRKSRHTGTPRTMNTLPVTSEGRKARQTVSARKSRRSDPETLRKMNAYWRAANYLCGRANLSLRQPAAA